MELRLPLLGTTKSLRLLVSEKFQQAKYAGDVKFSETKAANLKFRGRDFQLRYLPALAQKPAGNRAEQRQQQKSDDEPPGKASKQYFDPFDNPSEELLVGRIPQTNPTHNIVLNKFPIIPNHFILATKENKPQTYPLEADDIGLAYDCIKAWAQEEPVVSSQQSRPANDAGSLFAFFNSGPQSGASQAHRHIQFIPTEAMTINTDNDVRTWRTLLDNMHTECTPEPERNLDLLRHDAALPFLHYAVNINDKMTYQELHDKYIFLLKAARATEGGVLPRREAIEQCSITTYVGDEATTTKTDRNIMPGPEYEQDVGISYNLGMTINKMAIVPRCTGEVPFHDGPISINGTLLAGTLLTKSEKQWNLLREQPALVEDILSSAGCERIAFLPFIEGL